MKRAQYNNCNPDIFKTISNEESFKTHTTNDIVLDTRKSHEKLKINFHYSTIYISHVVKPRYRSVTQRSSLGCLAPLTRTYTGPDKQDLALSIVNVDSWEQHKSKKHLIHFKEVTRWRIGLRFSIITSSCNL
ncbi:conserved hypothetical protein [Trichinella spiralis]|uniref:hypothetical protein n=1 Tax=Trichinella spiralis TaxID=6334 RepID=UPI0001EFEB8B|nr:conserved hypothetical protein [Trichinella spiralis]